MQYELSGNASMTTRPEVYRIISNRDSEFRIAQRGRNKGISHWIAMGE